MNLLLQLATKGLIDGAVFALLAASFGIVYRSLRVFHLSFAGLFLVAAYLLYFLTSVVGLPALLAMLLTVAISAIAGLLTERYFYRFFFLRGSSPRSVMVASLGLFVILENLLALLFGNQSQTIERAAATTVLLGPVSLTSVQIGQFVVATLVLVGLGALTSRFRLFKAIWAMGDQPDLIPVLGLPLFRYREVVLVVSAVFGAIAACMITYDVGIDPHRGMSYLLIAAVAVLVGGLDRYSGWILGGFLLAILQNLLVWKLPARWMDLATFGVLLLLLLARPQGILGLRRRLEES